MNSTTDAQRAAAKPMPALVGASCGASTGGPADAGHRVILLASPAPWPVLAGELGLGTGIAGVGVTATNRRRPAAYARTFARRLGSTST